MKTKFATLALCLVAACVSQEEVTTPPVKVQPLPNFDAASVVSVKPTTIRTYSRNPNGTFQELTGAQCVLGGQGYAAEFLTPSIVELPEYGRASKPLSISCDHEGKVVSQTANIVNISAQKRVDDGRKSTSRMGLLGAVVGELTAAALDIAADQEGDQYSYGDTIRIIFE